MSWRSYRSSAEDEILHLILNGRPVSIDATHVEEVLEGHPEDTIAIVNGRHQEGSFRLKDGDSITLIRDGGFVREAASRMLCDRYTPAIHSRISSAKVGVAGLGGIGSHIAESLTRAGVGHLVIADFDRVDMTNLNRQNYYIEDIGKSKAQCTAGTLKRIDPGIDVEVFDGRVTRENADEVFRGCSVVCEAFDDASSKAMLIETLLSQNKDVKVVSVSGMAGFSTVNTMHVERRMSRLYVCGDCVSDSSTGAGLTATRVMACAGMAAHTALQIIINSTDDIC